MVRPRGLMGSERRMRLFGVALLMMLALLARSAGAMQVQGYENGTGAQTLRRSTMAGQEVRIYTYTQHHTDCSPAGDPVITLRTKPAHGVATIRASTVTTGPPRFGATNCTGKVLPGLGVFYTPAPGFRGTDQFDYDVTLTNGAAHDTAVVEVK